MRRELRLRLMLAGVLGVVRGLAIGVVLTRLAVATVRAAGTVAVPGPPVVTVAPWVQLALWGLVALVGARGADVGRDARSSGGSGRDWSAHEAGHGDRGAASTAGR